MCLFFKKGIDNGHKICYAEVERRDRLVLRKIIRLFRRDEAILRIDPWLGGKNEETILRRENCTELENCRRVRICAVVFRAEPNGTLQLQK